MSSLRRAAAGEGNMYGLYNSHTINVHLYIMITSRFLHSFEELAVCGRVFPWSTLGPSSSKGRSQKQLAALRNPLLCFHKQVGTKYPLEEIHFGMLTGDLMPESGDLGLGACAVIQQIYSIWQITQPLSLVFLLCIYMGEAICLSTSLFFFHQVDLLH